MRDSAAKGTGLGRDEVKRGTKIFAYLKEDQLEFLKGRSLKGWVKEHGESIGIPVELYVGKPKEKEATEWRTRRGRRI